MHGTFTPVIERCRPAMNHLRHGRITWTHLATYRLPLLGYNRMTYWGTHYDELAAKKADLSVYDRLAREHLNRQPTIAEDLVEALKANVCRSYRALSKVLNG